MVKSYLPFSVDQATDPYAVLGIPRNASNADIRTAWKKLIVKVHPDKVGDDGKLFRQVQTAYEMLAADAKKTPQQRQQAQRKRDQQQRRREFEKKKEDERLAAQRAYVERMKEMEKARAEREKKEEEARKERQMKERRIIAEGRHTYEERMARERHEAYLERCKQFNEQQAAKKKQYEQQRGRTWADRQKDRHAERFNSRLRKFLENEGGPSSQELQDEDVEPHEPERTGGDLRAPQQDGRGEAAEAAVERGEQPASSEDAASSSSASAATRDGGVVDGFGEQLFWERRRAEVVRNLHSWLPQTLGPHRSESTLFER